MRDGGVLDQVVATEDQGPAQLLAEHEPVAPRLEVLLAQLLGHRPQVPGGVGRVPGVGKGFLVHVGGVDLDAVAELLDA